MRTSLRDYFHALNILDMDVDVSVDGTDACIAVVPPIRLTSKGEELFGALLDNTDLYVDVEKYGNCILSDNDDDYNEEGLLSDAVSFIYALAGYCDSELFDKCFEGTDAKII